jgi:hypothetical protein
MASDIDRFADLELMRAKLADLLAPAPHEVFGDEPKARLERSKDRRAVAGAIQSAAAMVLAYAEAVAEGVYEVADHD